MNLLNNMQQKFKSMQFSSSICFEIAPFIHTPLELAFANCYLSVKFTVFVWKYLEMSQVQLDLQMNIFQKGPSVVP